MLVGDGSVLEWNIEPTADGKLRDAVNLNKYVKAEAKAQGSAPKSKWCEVTWRADGELLALGCRDGSIQLYRPNHRMAYSSIVHCRVCACVRVCLCVHTCTDALRVSVGGRCRDSNQL